VKKYIVITIMLLSLIGCTGHNYQANLHHPDHADHNTVEIEQSRTAKEIGDDLGELMLMLMIDGGLRGCGWPF
jgi:uncharacterized protein YcfL